MNSKFELTSEKAVIRVADGIHVLHRIRAIRNIIKDGRVVVRKGKLGGFVENKLNLSQDGACWIFDNAKVFGNALVDKDAYIKDNALVYGAAKISDESCIYSGARVFDKASVYGKAYLAGNVKVYGNVNIFGNANIFGQARVFGDAIVCDNAYIDGKARVFGKAYICGKDALLGNAVVFNENCILTIPAFYDRSRYITFVRTMSNSIFVNLESFNGDINRFEKMVRAHRHIEPLDTMESFVTNVLSEEYESYYIKAIELAKLYIDVKSSISKE